jgi:hypothetical protein
VQTNCHPSISSLSAGLIPSNRPRQSRRLQRLSRSTTLAAIGQPQGHTESTVLPTLARFFYADRLTPSWLSVAD